MTQGFRMEAPLNRDYCGLTDAKFSKFAPHLPTDTRGKPGVDGRRASRGLFRY